MGDYLTKLFSLLGEGIRVPAIILFLAMLTGTALDTFGIALVLPLVQLVSNPDKIEKIPLLNDVVSFFGIQGAENILLFVLVSFFIFYVLKNIFLAYVLYLQARLVAMRQAMFADRLFRHYMGRPYWLHIRQNSAEVIRNVVVTAPKVFKGSLFSLLSIAMEGLLILGAVTVLLWVEPQGAILAGGLLAVTMFVLSRTGRKRMVVWGRNTERCRASMIQSVNEGLHAYKEIRLTGRQNFFSDKFSRPNIESASYQIKAVLMGQFPKLVSEVILIAAVLFFVGTIVVWRGESIAGTVPVLGVFAAAALRIMPSANRVMMDVYNIRQAKPALDNIYRDYHYDGTAATTAIAPPAFSFAGEIVLENVSYRYAAADRASLKGVSLGIKKGGSIAFVGATGSGKTTLADIILGLLEPTEGRILVDGRDIRENVEGWQRRIGYVPQDFSLLDASLRENIAFGVPAHEINEARVWEAAGLAQISGMIENLEGGMDTPAGERGVRFSGGERQRIGIARALYHDPDVLVLDEATAALDTVTEKKFVQAIEALHGQKTLIIIAHRLSTVRG